MSASARILSEALVQPLADAGVDLEEIDVQRAGRRSLVRVVVDRDGGVDLDTVEAVSRIVSALLDAESLASAIPGPFVLEVTSPGVDRPLREPRHWRRAKGRLVQIDLLEGGSITGRIAEAGEDQVAVVPAGAEAPVEIELASIGRAVVQVEFNRADEE